MSQADVYIGDARAATLLRDDRDRVTFRYNADFLDDHRDTPVRDRSVSWTLLSTSTFRKVTADGGAVPPFFAGLLPEGVRLDAAIASTKTSADDHLTLLLSVGADTIGNVRIVPAGAAPCTRRASIASKPKQPSKNCPACAGTAAVQQPRQRSNYCTRCPSRGSSATAIYMGRTCLSMHQKRFGFPHRRTTCCAPSRIPAGAIRWRRCSTAATTD